MATVDGYRGTIAVKVGATTKIVEFVGAWSATISRDVIEGKPRIKATSTGAKPTSPGPLKAEGTLEGEIDKTVSGTNSDSNLGRNMLRDALMDGTTVDLKLTQVAGQELHSTKAVVSNAEINNDSEEIPTISFDFTFGDDFTWEDTAIA